MNITKTERDTENGKELMLALEGRLDTTTAPALGAELEASLPDAAKLVIDMAKLDYISSAGLRVLLTARKSLGTKGALTLRNVNEVVMDILQMTKFASIFTIE